MSDHVEFEDGRIWKANTITITTLYVRVARTLYRSDEHRELAIWFMDRAMCPGGLAVVRLSDLSVVGRLAWWHAVATTCREADSAGEGVASWTRLLAMRATHREFEDQARAGLGEDDTNLPPLVHPREQCLQALRRPVERIGAAPTGEGS